MITLIFWLTAWIIVLWILFKMFRLGGGDE